MSEKSIEEEFSEFLERNKIDTTSLSKKEKEKLFNVKDQRTLAILKARCDAYPYTSEEQYRIKCDSLGYMSEAMVDNCYEVCGNKANLPFLSVAEGACFRNCVTKFSVFYPTLG